MTHLTEETILAVRDQEPVADEVLSHISECAVCARALEDVRARAEAVERALAVLTMPVGVANRFQPAAAESGGVAADQSGPAASEESSRVGAKVLPISRGRRDARGGRSTRSGRREGRPGTGSRGRFLTIRWLSRAAVLVLIGVGGLSALPGPFNGWIPRVFSGADVPDATPPPAAQAVAQVGGRMDVATGPVAVRLEGVPPGTLIDVRRVAGQAVGVLAGTGSEFAYGSGEVRASVVGGPVTVELPEGVVPATLVVNGGTYLVVSATGMDVSGPRTTPGEESLVTFRVPN